MKRDAWIPWALGAGFGLFLLGGVVLSIVAAGSDPGLVAGAPQRVARAYVLPTGPAPALDLRVVARDASGIVVEARLRGPDGRPAAVEAIAGTLGRTTHARDDRPITFSPVPGGAWRAVVAPPAGGTWNVAVRAAGDAGAAEATLRL